MSLVFILAVQCVDWIIIDDKELSCVGLELHIVQSHKPCDFIRTVFIGQEVHDSLSEQLLPRFQLVTCQFDLQLVVIFIFQNNIEVFHGYKPLYDTCFGGHVVGYYYSLFTGFLYYEKYVNTRLDVYERLSQLADSSLCSDLLSLSRLLELSRDDCFEGELANETLLELRL